MHCDIIDPSFRALSRKVAIPVLEWNSISTLNMYCSYVRYSNISATLNARKYLEPTVLYCLTGYHSTRRSVLQYFCFCSASWGISLTTLEVRLVKWSRFFGTCHGWQHRWETFILLLYWHSNIWNRRGPRNQELVAFAAQLCISPINSLVWHIYKKDRRLNYLM